MKKEKKIGIWMDNRIANLVEYHHKKMETNIIESNFTHEDRTASLQKSENLMHNKEQQIQAEYYKKLGEAILKYDDVLLFGPTDAKTELYNSLRTDHRFEKINIDILQADKMTENQQHAFIKNHFEVN